MRNVNIVVDNDHYIYDDELYPEETLTGKTVGTLSTILEPPSTWSTVGRGLKRLPQQLLQRLPILPAQV